MRTFALALLLTSLSACSGDRPKFRGEGCDLNTECDPPLVCGFRRCRQECRDEVDCGLGLSCFLDARSGLGYCQLPDELTCLLDSDCREACGGDSACADQLACRDGECGQACVNDRDCVEGSTCIETGGTHTCEPVSPELCVYNSDCEPGLICDARQRCRPECRIDPSDPGRDCEYPRVCEMVPVDGVDTPLCVLPDGGV